VTLGVQIGLLVFAVIAAVAAAAVGRAIARGRFEISRAEARHLGRIGLFGLVGLALYATLATAVGYDWLLVVSLIGGAVVTAVLSVRLPAVWQASQRSLGRLVVGLRILSIVQVSGVIAFVLALLTGSYPR